MSTFTIKGEGYHPYIYYLVISPASSTSTIHSVRAILRPVRYRSAGGGHIETDKLDNTLSFS